jgi:hypothetical protein
VDGFEEIVELPGVQAAIEPQSAADVEARGTNAIQRLPSSRQEKVY